ncbi:MAG: DUF1254 domain-containing protein [Planctomycetes bacterium]|nr:DUF1254 domain-containing protein [Planctomycetota bacterium]
MKSTRTQRLLAAALFTASLALPALAQETIETRIGKLSFTHDFANGYPTKETVTKLYDERDFQRACQLYLWAMPMVSFGEVEHVLMDAPGSAYGDIIRVDTVPSISRFLTGNATTPYIMSWLNLEKSGPFVIEMPAGASAGFVNDLWQRNVTDVGLPGPDKGQGAKYLLLGPGQAAPEGTSGYTVVQTTTFNNLWLVRLLSPEAPEREAMLAKIRLYPFSQRAAAPATKVVSLGGGASVANAPRGFTYWEQLSHWVSAEPVQERDRIMMGMLKSLGIEKGKPFQPDARMKTIMTDATLVGEAMAKANDYEKRAMPQAHYADGSEWMFELCLDPSQESEFYTQLDERASWFYEASCTSKGMVSKTPGVGSVYLGINKDNDGNWLDGANTYRLHVPPNAPMTQFWSITLYDVSTRALIQNNSEVTDRSSRQDLVKNADGSVELYFGPAAPKGFEKNWIPTVAGKAWFPYFRLYGPTEAHFDRTWKLPNIEKVK